MGGNALKNTKTRRYNHNEYQQLTQKILSILRADFPQRDLGDIPAYRNKSTFGDLDVIVDSTDLNINLIEYIKTRFAPNECVQNTNVYSFDYQEFQIDLIGMPNKDFHIARHYYSWNDLGNIIGRLYHKMGFKFGHDGLHFLLKEDNYQFAELCLSKDIESILAFADLDPQRFLAGFNSLEDIFQYTASSPFFNKAIYLLENRSHKSRIRDRKRPTYNAFLRWLEEQDSLPEYPWASLKEQGGRQRNEQFMQRAFQYFPDFEHQLSVKDAAFAQWKRVRMKFNGRMVSEWTGLQNQVLGEFMKQLQVRQKAEFDDFYAWVDTATEAQVKAWVLS